MFFVNFVFIIIMTIYIYTLHVFNEFHSMTMTTNYCYMFVSCLLSSECHTKRNNKNTKQQPWLLLLRVQKSCTAWDTYKTLQITSWLAITAATHQQYVHLPKQSSFLKTLEAKHSSISSPQSQLNTVHFFPSTQNDMEAVIAGKENPKKIVVLSRTYFFRFISNSLQALPRLVPDLGFHQCGFRRRCLSQCLSSCQAILSPSNFLMASKRWVGW